MTVGSKMMAFTLCSSCQSSTSSLVKLLDIISVRVDSDYRQSSRDVLLLTLRLFAPTADLSTRMFVSRSLKQLNGSYLLNTLNVKRPPNRMFVNLFSELLVFSSFPYHECDM